MPTYLSKLFISILLCSLAIIESSIADNGQIIRPQRTIRATPVPGRSTTFIDARKMPLARNAVFQTNRIMQKHRGYNLDSLQFSSEIQIGLHQAMESNHYLPLMTLPRGQNKGTHRLRWKTLAPNAGCAVIQISPYAFSSQDNWRNPTVLLAEILDCSAPINGYRYGAIVDFDHLEKYPLFSYRRNGNNLPVIIRPRLFDTNRYFIRAIPVKSAMLLQDVATPSLEAELAYNTTPPTPPTIQDGHPKINFSHQIKMQPDNYNFACFQKVINAALFNNIFSNGEIVNVCNQDDDFLSEIGNFFEDLWEFITNAVNWISATYDKIKAELASIVLDMINCHSTLCTMAVNSVINSSMIMLGLPPTLPDSADLMSMGKDYLVESIAANAGVDPDLARAGIDQLERITADNETAMAASLPMIPATEFQYKPWILNFKVEKNSSYVAKQESATMIIENTEGLFKTVSIVIPKNLSGTTGTYNLPLFLQPTQDYRRWFAMHTDSMNYLAEMDLNGYITNEQNAFAEYGRFYNTYLSNNSAYTFIIKTMNSKGTKFQMKLKCNINFCVGSALP
ncbi:MAG: hypothetical protein A2504_09575 [Bdellovibrionales bacterium RIFOXYD12_FULL_39_22]|nr:MAG: hypothetical protein A2385_13065 [Bdellovibrionales bacterium RIFOXYB1_FULL_39_21]OFZ40976.1 MAG: hypothetical protein A2485_16575 [Bdellovibrionales bacterium RIFOXYC12_FULL_39_17]OFZ44804.1 MAG: hypothetical protein A2404_09865 [Bdellovibrionales bacterium RIFOXYC1_FULL_39_130]OFZ74269.1 MAG: hypothetical protein A2560_16830 [Bdellovibrionales bacterium RIFOXYD1_FULL_39_84]OFZ92133.1 MAG: hypothetical protein A2504_09575 [Bdellovibrionales bacterium RIFOXYD12_FULL_39_22]HLE12763.1 hy